MLITIAVIFIVLLTFILIVVNMYSDYSARREQDLRLIVNHAHNIVAECEELLLNQSQLPYSRTLVLILHMRIIRALKKRALDPKIQQQAQERIREEEKMIEDIKKEFHDDVAFRPPENDNMAVAQLRVIRRLRAIIKNEIKSGIAINPTDLKNEDRRLYLLVLKVNISNLLQRVLEMKRIHQLGTCKQLIAKGLDVIQRSGIKDGWLSEKADFLTQLRNGIEAEAKAGKRAKSATPNQQEENQEMDEIFGDKKKW